MGRKEGEECCLVPASFVTIDDEKGSRDNSMNSTSGAEKYNRAQILT